MRAMTGGNSDSRRWSRRTLEGSPGPINLHRPAAHRVLVLGALVSGCRSVTEVSDLLGLEADRVEDAAKGAGLVRGRDVATGETVLLEVPEAERRAGWKALRDAADISPATLNRLLHYLEYRGLIAPAIYPIEQREGEVREVSDEHPPENRWPEKPAPWHRWTAGISGVRRPRGLWLFRLQPRVRDSWLLARSDGRWVAVNHGPEHWSVPQVEDPILRVDVVYEPPLPVVRWDGEREALLRRILTSLHGMEAVAPVLADCLEMGNGASARIRVRPIRFLVDDLVADMRFMVYEGGEAVPASDWLEAHPGEHPQDARWVTTWRIPSPAERSV